MPTWQSNIHKSPFVDSKQNDWSANKKNKPEVSKASNLTATPTYSSKVTLSSYYLVPGMV